MTSNGSNGSGPDSSPYHQLEPLPPPPDGYVADVNLDGERPWVRQLFIRMEWNRRIAKTVTDNQLKLAQGMQSVDQLKKDVSNLGYRISNHELSHECAEPEAS